MLTEPKLILQKENFRLTAGSFLFAYWALPKPILSVECEELSHNLICGIECDVTFTVHFSWHECIHADFDARSCHVAR